MAKIACCYNCVFAFLDREHSVECYHAGIVNWPACANHPDSYGRMRRTPERGICPNYRPRPPVPQGESVKTIPLGGGFVTYVDAADFNWLNQWTWHLCGLYAGRMEKGKVIFMHREILKPPKGMVVDHKNRNKLDNTRDNLRPFTRAQNACNRPKRRGSSSRFRGVVHRKKDDKYWAQVYYKGERLFVGNFTDEIEAARAHDYKAVELFGEFAQLNFPKEWPPERRDQVHAQGAAERRRLEARARGKEAAKKAPRKTPAAKRKTKRKRATGHKSRATRTARTKTQGRKGAKGQTKAKTAKPRATRDERRNPNGPPPRSGQNARPRRKPEGTEDHRGKKNGRRVGLAPPTPLRRLGAAGTKGAAHASDAIRPHETGP